MSGLFSGSGSGAGASGSGMVVIGAGSSVAGSSSLGWNVRNPWDDGIVGGWWL